MLDYFSTLTANRAGILAAGYLEGFLGLTDVPAEHIFTGTGLIGCEGAQVLHRWARGGDSRGHGSPQARRQERDTTMHQSVRTEVLIFLG
jgi:hypothetical protein